VFSLLPALACALSCLGGHAADHVPGADRLHAPVRWRDSAAIGLPEDGSMVRGVRFPAEGRTFFTWDPVLRRSPDRSWRRWGTDDMVRTTLRVLRGFHRGVRTPLGSASAT
jgi:hypothetical protein